MPEPEDFPPIAQKQMAAQNEPKLVGAETEQKKQRKSLLERLASVGLGSKRDQAAPQASIDNEPRIIEQPMESEPMAESHDKMMPAEAATETTATEDEAPVDKQPAVEEPAVEDADAAADGDNVHQLEPQIDPSLDDDDLEIPAFLRRQAN